MSDPSLEALAQARAKFLELVSGIRPDLHRHCAGLTGSVIDGEDIVQETLARAYYQLSVSPQMPELRPWLFRVAQDAAADFLRKVDRRPPSPVVAAEARRERLEKLNRYVALFNDGNWSALRAMLSGEVELEVISHRPLRGEEAGSYYARYAEIPDVHLDVVVLEGREAILVNNTGPHRHPPYFMLLEFDGDKVASIRDFRYVPYIAQGAEVRPVDAAPIQ